MRLANPREDKPFVCMVVYNNYRGDGRVRREAEKLAANGFHVLCFGTRSEANTRDYSLNGVQVHEFGRRKYRGKSMSVYFLSYLRFLLTASMACIGLLWQGRLDVVHAHNLPDFLVFAGLVPRLAGRKVVLDVHDSVPETFSAKFPGSPVFQSMLRLEERLSARVADRVVCVNEPQRDVLVARGLPSIKTFICMNSPDSAIFDGSQRAEQPLADGGHFDVIYHGTMAERLGIDLIIRSVALVQERIPEIRLHLWGGGDDLTRFMELADELRIDASFCPEGVRLEDLPSHLAPMHLGVIGNRRNPATELMLPVKLMEYVAMGIPVVAPRLRTIEHYFSDEMVSYYEPDNVQAFADAIHLAYDQPELGRLKVRRADEFLKRYGWKQRSEEFVGFYRELVEDD